MSRPTIDMIVGKTCYWGRHTIEAIAEGGLIRLNVYTNCPKTFLISETVGTKKGLMEWADALPQDIIGSLGTTYTDNRLDKNSKYVNYGSEPKVDYFLKCFRKSLVVSD
jgi:hypothetical protein